MTNQLIKRVVVGGYIKADTSGVGNWEVGKIVDADSKYVWFEAAIDGQTVKVLRTESFKATREEFEAAQGKQEVVAAQILDAQLEAEIESSDVDDFELEQELDGVKSLMSGVVPQVYRERYIKAKSPQGNASLINGDQVSLRLTMMTLDQTYTFVATETETDEVELRSKYAHLNFGMQRMNLGNRLRQHYRNIMKPRSV